jgi:hypothetical protein
VAGRTEFNSGKFSELVLLLAELSAADPLMSRVKLNKLLYRSDFEAFRLLGRSITGATYIRGEHGPMAAELPRAEDDLGRRGLLSWKQIPAGPYVQKVPIANEDADRSLFQQEELSIVNTAIKELEEHGGSGASKWSHEESAGWRLNKDGAEISYESGLIDVTPLDPRRAQLLRDYVDTLRV